MKQMYILKTELLQFFSSKIYLAPKGICHFSEC